MRGDVVTLEDIDGALPRTVSVSATAAELSATRLGRKRRTQIIIVPLTAGVTVTITKGDSTAVANAGIVLTANQAFVEADDGGFKCWQGAIQVVASGAGSVAINETFER